jgi:FAD/FMN-containing dehydrogenase
VTDVTDTGGSRGRGQPEAGPETPASPARLLPAREPAGKPAAHQAAVAALQAAYAAIPPGSPVRLAKRTSNLFRFRDTAATGARGGSGASAISGARGGSARRLDAPGESEAPRGGSVARGGSAARKGGSAARKGTSAARGLDVSAFRRVLSVDPRSRTAVTGGMTTYEDLADATLRHDLMPLVVPQLKTITIGGAVTGLGIESSSLRSGMPHESVLEMEILTGDGRVITATPGGEHDALYRGFPNSYGTLGYALSLTIELEPVRPFVHLRHFRFGSPEACMDAVAAIAADGSYQGHRADFVDGTAFGLDELYLTVGSFSDVAPWRSDYTRARVYYQSIRGPHEDFLTIRDYLWRWDTDWFWCSRPFGVQRPVIRRLWPRRYRRSDVYRKLVALDRRHGLSAALNARRGAPRHEDVIQDVEIPVERGAEFLRTFAAGVGMSPVWMCPLRLRGAGPGGRLPGISRDDGPGGRLPGMSRADPPWPLYPLEPDRVYVNFGFWGTVPLPPGKADGYYNRLVEETVTGLGGHKGLYSTSFYPEEEFWALYNGPAYAALKAEYDPAGRLAGLYEKCVRGR